MVWKKRTAMISAALQHDVGWLWPRRERDTCIMVLDPTSRAHPSPWTGTWGACPKESESHVLLLPGRVMWGLKEDTGGGLGAIPSHRLTGQPSVTQLKNGCWTRIKRGGPRRLHTAQMQCQVALWLGGGWHRVEPSSGPVTPGRIIETQP